jgi:hypothetical protein
MKILPGKASLDTVEASVLDLPQKALMHLA